MLLIEATSLCVSFCPIAPSLSIQLDRHVRASVLSQEEGVVWGSMKMLVPRCSFEGMKWESWEDSPHLSEGITLCCHSVHYILAWRSHQVAINQPKLLLSLGLGKPWQARWLLGRFWTFQILGRNTIPIPVWIMSWTRAMPSRSQFLPGLPTGL